MKNIYIIAFILGLVSCSDPFITIEESTSCEIIKEYKHCTCDSVVYMDCGSVYKISSGKDVSFYCEDDPSLYANCREQKENIDAYCVCKVKK